MEELIDIISIICACSTPRLHNFQAPYYHISCIGDSAGHTVNPMTHNNYAAKLQYPITYVWSALKVDGSVWVLSRMIIVGSLLQDNWEGLISWKNFLFADTSIEGVLGMPFLPLSNTNMDLQKACLLELHNTEVMPFGHHLESWVCW